MSDRNTDAENRPNADGDSDTIIRGTSDSGSGGDQTFIDPAAATPGNGSSGGGSGAGKRRGRPKGSKNATAPKASKLDLGPFAGILVGIHGMLAAISRTPELELDEDDGEKLAKASQRVMRHYVALEVSEKAADWSNLFLAIGGIYGPRVLAFKIRKSREREEKKVTRHQEPQAPPAPMPQAPSVGGTVVQMPYVHTPMKGGDF